MITYSIFFAPFFLAYFISETHKWTTEQLTVLHVDAAEELLGDFEQVNFCVLHVLFCKLGMILTVPITGLLE